MLSVEEHEEDNDDDESKSFDFLPIDGQGKGQGQELHGLCASFLVLFLSLFSFFEECEFDRKTLDNAANTGSSFLFFEK